MNRPIFQIFRRFMHDRKLPEVTVSRFTPANLIGTQSPRKADYSLPKTKYQPMGYFNNLNEVVKARNNYNKAIREIYIKNST